MFILVRWFNIEKTKTYYAGATGRAVLQMSAPIPYFR